MASISEYHDTLVSDHVTPGEREGEQVTTVSSQHVNAGVIHQNTALEINYLQSCTATE